eukprot:jgi/Ulvmu1/2188/UM013_0034.1
MLSTTLRSAVHSATQMGCPTCSPGNGEANECNGCGSLEADMTIVVTTSPVQSNPSLELIDCTMQSFSYAPGLAACKKLLVCDHYKVHEGSSKSFRSGVITAAQEPRYKEYKRLLAERIQAAEPGSPFSNMTMLELPSHHGFGFAVKAALKHVSTPLVMVIQHDRNLNRPVDIGGLVAVLRTRTDVNMISLLTKTTMHHATRVQSRCTQSQHGCPVTLAEWTALAQPHHIGSVRLIRMLQWLDSTHIAKVGFYRSVVFRKGLVKRGAFIEDRLGNAMLDALRRDGAAAPPRFGCWINDDGVRVPMVVHNHGRAFLTRDEKHGRWERGAGERRVARGRSSSSDDGAEDGVAVAAMSHLFGAASLSAGHSVLQQGAHASRSQHDSDTSRPQQEAGQAVGGGSVAGA